MHCKVYIEILEALGQVHSCVFNLEIHDEAYKFKKQNKLYGAKMICYLNISTMAHPNLHSGVSRNNLINQQCII